MTKAEIDLTVAQGLALAAMDRARSIRTSGPLAQTLRDRADRRADDVRWLERRADDARWLEKVA